MSIKQIISLCVAAGGILLNQGCASSASNLKASEIANDEGAFFGKLTITNHGEDITRKCYVRFVDRNDDKKIYTSLDETGWIFTSAKSGPTILSFVTCKQGSLVPYQIGYEGKDLQFLIGNQKAINYFGHVTIELNHDDSGIVTGAILGGVIGAAIAANDGERPATITVQDKSSEALAEYKKRFSSEASLLQPFTTVIKYNPTRQPASTK